MASEGIVEMNSSEHEGCIVNSSTIDVGYNMAMNEEDIANVSSALVFRVPKPLQNSDESAYSPRLVSIGPLHYGKEELKGMEKSKSEAVRRMQKRIQKRDLCASIKSIVEKDIVMKDKEIRVFYGEDITGFSPIELAWMVTRDACFIFELLVNFGGQCHPSDQFYMEEVIAYSWIHDPVFDAITQNPTIGILVDDVFLLENQIPLWILQHLLEIQVGSADGAKRNLNDLVILMLRSAVRHSTFMWYVSNDFNKCSHILEALYLGMIGNPGYYLRSEPLSLKCSSSDLNCVKMCIEKCIEKGKGAISRTWCKESSLRAISSNADPEEVRRILQVKLPTAIELTRSGVKFYAVTLDEIKSGPGYTAIFFINFDEKTSTLYLPELSVTSESDSVIRNFIARK